MEPGYIGSIDFQEMIMTKKEVLILGGGYAGLLAALRLNSRGDSHKQNITLIDASDHFTERIRFHEVLVGKEPEKIRFSDFLADTHVRFAQGRVTGIQPDQQLVTVRADGELHTLRYDYLIYALGSQLDLDIIPGIREHAHSVTDEKSTYALKEELSQLATQSSAGRVIICGSGYTGLEIATEIADRYSQLKLSIVTKGTLRDQLSDRGTRYLKKRLHQQGIDVLEARQICAIEPNQLCLDDGERLSADIVIWAGPFTTPTLAKEADLPVNGQNQVPVDSYLSVDGYPNMLVVGDAAARPGIRMACATAMPMGAYAGDRVADLIEGHTSNPFRFNYLLRCVALGGPTGLVQLTRRDDSVRNIVVTGRLAGWVKRYILDYTVNAIKREKVKPGSYRWPH